MARPLLFEVKLTGAQRSKRYRDRRRQELKELRELRGDARNKVTPQKRKRASPTKAVEGLTTVLISKC
jgi:hypothetical protein